MAVCFNCKTLDKKTSVDPEKISEKAYPRYEQAVKKFQLKIWFNPGLS